jgi:general secretion pathway protein B
MSYILNALKQSESQRNRGEIPHIDSQPEFVKATPSKWGEHAWKWLALAASVAFLLRLAWMRFAGAPRVVDETTPVSPPLAESASPLAAPQPPAPLAQPLEQAPRLSALEEMAGVRIRLEEDAPANVAAPPGASPGVRESPRIVLEMPVSNGVTPRPAPPLLAAPVAPPAVRETPPAEVLSGVNHWKTLPADVQKQMRDMAFTAHIYSSDPAARFIRVSGRTLHEGDQLAAELKLQQITRDGIVFGYRGDKFWFGFN